MSYLTLLIHCVRTLLIIKVIQIISNCYKKACHNNFIHKSKNGEPLTIDKLYNILHVLPIIGNIIALEYNSISILKIIVENIASLCLNKMNL